MGGDSGLAVTVPAALHVLKCEPSLSLILVGDQDKISEELKKHHGAEHPRLSIHHASEEIAMDELPSAALRGKKDSSMRIAIELVRDGKASACVSAGNTGALMVLSRFILRTLPGIERPAIIAQFPARNHQRGVRVLDLGANVDSSAEHLFQFAVMGSVLTSAVENIASPTVGLLNIGVEEIKGNEQVKQTAELLSASKLNYVGYVEGDAIFSGEVDVIVCDGFVGNVALKTIEGATKLIGSYAKKAFMDTLYSKLVGMLAKPVFHRLRRQLDPDRYNGATFIGLNGIVVKSHGGADVVGFGCAIKKACLEIEKDVLTRISHEVSEMLEGSP